MITIMCLAFALGALIMYEYIKLGKEAELKREKEKELKKKKNGLNIIQ